MSNYYDLLGISKNASETEIKKAYRKMALKFHPDRNPDNKEESEKKFKEIGKAYKVLSDPNLKSRYDQFGDSGLDGNPDMANFNPFDFFSGFGGFGNMFNNQRQEEKFNKVPPQEFNLKTELEVLYKGATKNIKISKKQKCDFCDGIGARDSSSIIQCTLCKGKGQIIKMNRIGPMIQQSIQACYQCSSKGKVIKKGDECMKCNGSKYMNVIKKVEFYIKPGSVNGDRIILYGEGDWHPDHDVTSDLVIILNETNGSNGMARVGENLLLKLKISLVEALSGVEKIIKHLDDRHMLIQYDGIIKPNQKMMIKGEGMIINNEYRRGDLIIEFIIDFPKELSKERKVYLAKILPKPSKQIWDIDKNNVEYDTVELKHYIEDTYQKPHKTPDLEEPNGVECHPQ